MTPEDQPAPAASPSLTEEELDGIFHRALRTTAIMAVVVTAILAVAAGWQTGLLLLAGAVISWSGIREWRNLTSLVFDRLQNQQNPRPAGRTTVMFFLRLGIAAGILYGSLRCLHGSVYALVAGLGLGLIALSYEALRLLR